MIRNWHKNLFRQTAVLTMLFSLAGTSPVSLAAERVSDIPKSAQTYLDFPPDRPLSRSSYFEVIDDFNSGEPESKSGSVWEARKKKKHVSYTLSYRREDARSGQRGHSLKINFHLKSGGELILRKGLGELDVSQGDYLGFYAKIMIPEAERVEIKPDDKDPCSCFFPVRLWMAAEDRKSQRKAVSWDEQLCEVPPGQWQKVIIPLKKFKGVDFNEFTAIEVVLKGRKNTGKQSILIDEMVIGGRQDVKFESQRDNLKGFPDQVYHEERAKSLREKISRDSTAKVALRDIAADTWKYFEYARDLKSDLIVDHIRVGKGPLAADYTSITNIAMDFLAIVAAYDLGFIERSHAVNRAKSVLKTMDRLDRWKGFFYNFYNTQTLRVTRNFISSVDSGWLAVSLVVLRQAFGGELADHATRLLDEFDFSEFLDPENNLLALGIDPDTGETAGSHYGMLGTEARATSFYAIGKGDLPREHWWYLFRTLPGIWKWQTQKPQGKYVTRDGIDYFQGYYEKDGKKFVPSWGGSLFEMLMPTLVMRERELAPKAMGLNNRIYTELHRNYAIKEKKYPVWGISPASTSDGRFWKYNEYGVKSLSAKGYPDTGVITPHVSFLALDSLPQEALENIRRWFDYPIYGAYGFFDSMDFRTGQVNPQYLALDQGMILVAICNFLKGGSIQKRYHQDPVVKNAEDLLRLENFFD